MKIQGQLRQLRQLSKYLIKFLYCYIEQIADVYDGLRLRNKGSKLSLKTSNSLISLIPLISPLPTPHSLLFQLKGQIQVI